MDSKNNPTTELLNILTKAIDSKVYGSIEVYLEEGQITQISQRVIKKIKRQKNTTEHKISKPLKSNKNNHQEVTLEFRN